MNDPVEILDLLVAKAREIPELVALVGGDPQRIEAWHTQWPENNSVIGALSTQDDRSVRFIFQRTRPARRGEGIWWAHDYLVQFRPEAERDEEHSGQVRMFRALVNGKTADGGRWLHQCVRPNTDAVRTMQLAPRVFGAPGGRVLELWLGTFEVGDREA